ncbi:MAG: FG-GAP-like repeat-containing protein [Calditrichaeota bacterium]|nr:FG-GAP-like repeat-containing protein [Calditrichota bacterium]
MSGLPPNTQGIGAKIRVTGGAVQQSKEIIAGGTYLSGSDPLVTFAAAGGGKLEIEVLWRSGKVSWVHDARPNVLYEIFEQGASADQRAQRASSPAPAPYFEDVSDQLDHKHHEDPFDDFKRQPLLPHRLSQFGPGVAWLDIDGDDDDDLIITTGKGGQVALYRNDREQGFLRIANPRLNQDSESDQTSVLGWRGDAGLASVLIGTSNYENNAEGEAFLLRLDFTAQSLVKTTKVRGTSSSTGPMAMADYDSDGDLDLFVGGRMIPGRYPEPASSVLYQSDRGTFTVDEANTELFSLLGMVSAAVFSDIDGDADPDLILAVEWGTIMVFRNTRGRFVDVTAELGLDQYTGIWNGVTTGDLDEDGSQDIIATNWGLNNPHRASDEHPIWLYYGDFDRNGTMDIIEAHFDMAQAKIVPESHRETLIKAIPIVRSRVPTYKVYSKAGMADIIGADSTRSRQLKVNELRHMVFLNRGDRFEAVALPLEAQFAPAFSVGVADFNGDGHDDVFISQNFFGMPAEEARSDAGRGLWLKGDGTGRLKAVPGHISGVKIYGEQRGAALADYDHDGRVDLVVTQNGAETKLYRNVGATPGLRVRLRGSEDNRLGIGALLRVLYEDSAGPVREIHAGSGYLSQDSAVQVMGLKKQPTGLWVRWPGGRITTSKLAEHSHNIIIDINGVVTNND